MAKSTPTMLMALCLVVVAQSAWGDGGFVWNRGADLMEPQQVAALYHDGTTEVLVLRVRYRGEAQDFGWIVPLPSVPDVDVAEQRESRWGGARESVLTELGELTGFRMWERARAPRRRAFEHRSASAGVEVMERRQVGVYDVAVLSAEDASSLADWLAENDYSFPSDRADVLEHYAVRGWYYAAMRIAGDGLTQDLRRELRSGEIQPVVFRFEGDSLVYPLRISSVNTGETEVVLYVLADRPMVPAAGPRAEEIGLDLNMCVFDQLGTGWVDPEYGTYRKVGREELPLTGKAVGADPEGIYVSKYRIVYASEEMTDDLTFGPFDPVAYWRQALDSADTLEERAMASWVLAWHSPAMLETMAVHPDWQLRAAAAFCEKTPPGLLEHLACDEEADVRWMVAKNPSTSPELLRVLSCDSDPTVREAVAWCRRTPGEALTALAADEDPRIRYLARANPSAPRELWVACAEDPRPEVRDEVARSPRAPVDVIELLARDRDPSVRRGAVGNPRISSQLREAFATDPDPGVRAAVAWTCGEEQLDVLVFLSHDPEPRVRRAVAGNRSCPAWLLEALAYDEDVDVRREVVLNRNTEPETMAHLSVDDAVFIRGWVGFLPWTPVPVLRALSEDREPPVRASTAHNRASPVDVLIALADDSSELVRKTVARNPNTPPWVLASLAADTSSAVREGVAGNRNAPSDVLVALALDVTPSVRRRVAGNRATPIDVLLALAADDDGRTRGRARRTLRYFGYFYDELVGR